MARSISAIAVITSQVENEPPPPSKPASVPTQHPPGSAGKLAVLIERYASGEELWHPLDSNDGNGASTECLPLGRNKRGGLIRSYGKCHTCLIRKVHSYGACKGCFSRHSRAVRLGTTTWEQLVAAGKILAVPKRRSND